MRCSIHYGFGDFSISIRSVFLNFLFKIDELNHFIAIMRSINGEREREDVQNEAKAANDVITVSYSVECQLDSL